MDKEKETHEIDWSNIKLDKVRSCVISGFTEMFEESQVSRGDVIVVDEQLYHLCQLNDEQNLIDGISADVTVVRKRMFYWPLIKIVYFGNNLVTEGNKQEISISFSKEPSSDIVKKIYYKDLI